MFVRKFVLPGIVAGVATATALAGIAAAHPGDPHPATQQDAVDSTGPATYLAAGLRGANEVPVPGGPAVGDPDGRATAVVRLQGNQVRFAVRWEQVATPTALHIHAGAKGANGGIKIGFFGSQLPSSARAVSGAVTVTDQALLNAIRGGSKEFYLNLHTTEFTGGAVRGQLHTLPEPANLDGVLNGATQSNLAAKADGKQEVPGPKPSGDPDGRAAWLVTAHGTDLSYVASWNRIGAPTNGHLHAGRKGANGPIAADLFAATAGLPASITGIAGTVPVTAELAGRIASYPKDFYTNLHTAEFDGGAVRGQLSKATTRQPQAVNAEVLGGAQLYHCTGNAFGQFGVAAVLRGNVLHSFVQPVAGPPQWQAPDGTAVTGTLVTKSPNGDGNIPELVLDATRTGDRTGLFGGTRQILRLNTAGGTAPAGGCESGAIAATPYKADYLFLD